MKAEVHLAQGMTFVGKADTGHWVPMDTEAAFGGADAAAKPLELLLVALGGCTGMDVVSILRKKRTPFTSFSVEMDADRAAEHPRVLTRIHIVYRVAGEGVAERDVQEAARLSFEKYCAVSAMLSKACPVTYECRVG